MEPRPLPHLLHQENPVAYEALLASPPKPASAAAFRLSVPLRPRWSPCSSPVWLCGLCSALLPAGTWFSLTAARQTPSPAPSLNFTAASLDQLSFCFLNQAHSLLQVFALALLCIWNAVLPDLPMADCFSSFISKFKSHQLIEIFPDHLCQVNP